MSWTKRQFVTEAFDALGFGSYQFDLEPEQLQGALRKLDAMMGEWNAENIRVGYPMTETPEDSDLDTETGVPDAANAAIYQNLALRVAPSVGKTAGKDLKIAARKSYNVLLAAFAKRPKMQPNEYAAPAGAGNRRRRFLIPPENKDMPPADSGLDFE